MSITPLSLAQLLMRPGFIATEVLSADAAQALLSLPRAQPSAPLMATILQRFAAADAVDAAMRPGSSAPAAGPSTEGAATATREPYRVDIAGQPFILALRGSYGEGEQIRIIIEQEPDALVRSDPSFVAATGHAAAGSAYAAPLAAMAPAQGETLLLSADAQRLGSLLNRIEAADARVTLTLPPGRPPGPPSAEALARAISESGMFYESHLADWVQGRRTLEAVRRERQAQSAPASAPGSPAARAAVPATPQGAGSVLQTLLPVVKEQLNAIDTERFTVYGAVWANQQAQITIAHEYANSGSSERQDIQPAWTTTLKLRLPSLGRVEAALLLTGHTLRLVLASETDTAATFRSGLDALSQSLAAQGLSLQAVRWETFDVPA
jgi:hypothetical protein